MFEFHIGVYFETLIEWMTDNFGSIFDGIRVTILAVINGFENALLFIPSIVLIIAIVLLAWRIAGRGIAIFAAIGLLLIDAMQLWSETMETLSLVFTSTMIALLIGIPLGIWMSRNNKVDRTIRPILDFMQTMPAFVYLIPAVIFFDLG